jgi:hypothetical protein
MPEVKYNGKGQQERINDRLRNSGGHYPGYEHLMANVVHETHPTRTITNIHHGASEKQHGPVHPGEGDLYGRKRGSV